jgi:hypothetical protein
MWRYGFADGAITWMAGIDVLLDAPGAPKDEIKNRLREAVTPLTISARAADVWHNFELEQQFTGPQEQTRRTQFRARTFDGKTGRGLIGIATDVTEKHRTSRR